MSTISELLKQNSNDFTKTERKLSSIILKNYPISALGSINSLAEEAEVSTPSVLRLVKKLGFKGFPEFQKKLRSELQTTLNPIAKHDLWAKQAPTEHILNRFADAVTENIRQSLALIETEQFDSCCQLLADDSRQIFVAGGRITGALADYLYMHLKMMRKSVHQIRASTSIWPHDILDLQDDDVLILFDVRRYENNSIKLAELAKERGVTVILITDQWHSPVAAFADYSFANYIAVPSAWDSMSAIFLLVETFIAALQAEIWQEAKVRVEELEETFGRTGLFRK